MSRIKNGYVVLRLPNGREVYEHVVIAERVLGRPLKLHEQVHHIDLDRSHNAKSNLLICTRNFHRLLHERLASLRGCGNPNYRQCRRCRRWVAPGRLSEAGSHPARISGTGVVCKTAP